MSVTGYPDEVAAVLGRLKTQWGATTPIAWPNVRFDPARKDGNPDGAPLTTLAPWIRATVMPFDAGVVTMAAPGERTARHSGLLMVQVFVPAGSGDGRARSLAEQVCAAFRGVTADGIRYHGPGGELPSARAIGDDGRGWYQWQVHVPYQRDSTF